MLMEIFSVYFFLPCGRVDFQGGGVFVFLPLET